MNEESANQDRPWRVRQPYGWKLVLGLLVGVVLLAISARRTEIDKGVYLTAEGLAHAAGLKKDAEVSEGWNNFFQSAFPLVFAEKTPIGLIDDFDRDRLPRFSHIVREPTRELNVDQGKWVETGHKEYLVQPFGYLAYVVWKMVETIEMAVWGTLLALLLSLPLAYFSSRGYSWNVVTYTLARGLCSFSRALPELVIAILMVIMYGFGTIPGVIALGIHCCGFFGKFFADDIENADPGPQDALRSTGANKLKVLWYAVLPQVTPNFLAYLQYILERNVRTATVLGIVGAGGIGLELKGRLELTDYGHVSTILLVIFLTVFVLEQITQRIRARFIRVEK